MTHVPHPLSPLGRSSSRPRINPPESARGPFTRQPQSLQDHKDSCHSSIWRRASGAWAGGVYETWEAGFMCLCFNYPIHNITVLVRILICFLMYPRILCMRKRMIHLWWADCGAKSCFILIILNDPILFFSPTHGGIWVEFTVKNNNKKLNIAKISVFQESFMDGETEYFQVSKFKGGWSYLDRLLDPTLLYIILIPHNYLSTRFVPRNHIGQCSYWSTVLFLAVCSG